MGETNKPAGAAAPSRKVFSREEVAALSAAGKHVYLFKGGVYDVNLDELMHPGGREVRAAAAVPAAAKRNSMLPHASGRLHTRWASREQDWTSSCSCAHASGSQTIPQGGLE